MKRSCELDLLHEIPAGDQLGEEIREDAAGALLKTVINGCRMHCCHFAGFSFITIVRAGRRCSFGLTPPPGKFIAAFDEAMGWPAQRRVSSQLEMGQIQLWFAVYGRAVTRFAGRRSCRLRRAICDGSLGGLRRG